MSEMEFSFTVNRRSLPVEPVSVSADAETRAKLARRFGLIAINRLQARLTLVPDGDAIKASGEFEADVVQSCAVTGDDLPVKIREDLALIFVPDREIADEEIELTAENCDEIPFTGDTIELGEAVAQSLALAVDPYATGPDADRIRREEGLANAAPGGPFAALAGLKKQD